MMNFSNYESADSVGIVTGYIVGNKPIRLATIAKAVFIYYYNRIE